MCCACPGLGARRREIGDVVIEWMRGGWSEDEITEMRMIGIGETYVYK